VGSNADRETGQDGQGGGVARLHHFLLLTVVDRRKLRAIELGSLQNRRDRRARERA
jgi:hypothetical protein